MKVYIGHSRQWDYERKLYNPILDSEICKEHKIIFPHINEKSFNTKKIIEEADLFIAEVSVPSLGLGIEIGRAEQIGKKILCIYNKEYKLPESLKFVETDIIEYKDETDMVNKIKEYIQKQIMKGNQ